MRNIIKFGIGGLVTLGALALPAVASASTVPANFPGNNGTSCNAWHGAPGGFGPDSPYWALAQSPNVAVDQYSGYQFGQDQGSTTTGLNNATFCGNTAPAPAPGLNG